MNDLIAFVTARLDEDEAAARAATPGPWEFEGDDPTDDELFTVHEDDPAAGVAFGDAVAYTRGEGRPGSEGRQVANGRFMERHDPARALREVTAKRAILSEYERVAGSAKAYPNSATITSLGAAQTILKALGSVWSDHADYRPAEWA